jgi:hypothetical protein
VSASSHYGCIGEFEDVGTLLSAVSSLRKRGYTRLEAYTPYPVEGLAQALGPMRDRTAFAMLMGGIAAGVATLALQYYAAVVDYPINVGGRPDASWPAFIPAAVEMTILFAALAGLVSMLRSNGLPRLHHPLFESERFAQASRAGLFVVVLAVDPHYEADGARRDLTELQATHVETVPA